MNIVCLDLEGVLVPEIWQHVAARLQTEELNLTTRDVADYRELMDRRMEICRDKNITLKKIQSLILELGPLEGAVEFVEKIRARYQLIILSDTFYEFASPLVSALGSPTLFCHSIRQEGREMIYTLRQEDQKKKTVEAFRGLNFKVFAAGDSFNDISMLRAAHEGCLFRAPEKMAMDFPEFENTSNYQELYDAIKGFLG